MKRLVIAVDCDDVLVATTPYFVEAYNTLYGTSVALAQAHSGGEKVWQADLDLLNDRLRGLMEAEAYSLLKPSREAIEVLQRLSARHELHVVTARREEERELTQRMLDTVLPGVFTSMDLVGWKGSKGDVCQRIGASILIDDSARHLHDAIDKGLSKKGALLFGEYPWNAEHSGGDLLHCRTWHDVEAAVHKVAIEE